LRELNLAAHLFEAARRQPQSPAVSDGVRAWSYGEFAHRISCLAGGLAVTRTFVAALEPRHCFKAASRFEFQPLSGGKGCGKPSRGSGSSGPITKRNAPSVAIALSDPDNRLVPSG
jgi:hypothetical protein